MVTWPTFRRSGPIAVDLGVRAVKLVQMNADRSRIVESVRWDLPLEAPADLDPGELGRPYSEEACFHRAPD